jgi:beta-glucosidase
MQAAAGAVQAGINQFLDKYEDGVRGALKKNLLTEADMDASLEGAYRVMIRLGLLDPPARVPYAAIQDGPEPWNGDKTRQLAWMITQKSIVLLRNENKALPLDRHRLKSIAVIGANEVALDWYGGTPAYTITPLQGIRDKVGTQVNVDQLAYWDVAAHKFVTESGEVRLMVGSSSLDIRLRRTHRVTK